MISFTVKLFTNFLLNTSLELLDRLHQLRMDRPCLERTQVALHQSVLL